MKKLLVAACLIVSCSTVFANQPKQTKGKAMTPKDIVDTAVSAGQFTTLATALKAAGLIETLKGPGPFTVFAPTDKAFASLPSGTVEKLLKNKPALTRVLTYHVVAGKVTAADVTKLSEATTVEGSKLAIHAGNGAVTIGENSKVTGADVNATNGVIHIIDHVLLPPNLEL